MTDRPIASWRRSTTAVAAALALVMVAACTSTPSAAPGSPSTVASIEVPATGDPGTGTGTTPRTGPTGSAPPEVGRRDTEFPELGATDLDVSEYDLALDYDIEDRRLAGRATIALTTLAPLDEVTLDFQGLGVERVEIDGREATHAHRDRKLRIETGERVAAGTSMRISVTYAGTPEPVATDALGGVEVGWHSSRQGSFVLAEPEGASTWFPVNNHPRDKATYRFAITVPQPYEAIANGVLERTEDVGSSRTFHWSMDAPMANYLATVVTGEFVEHPGGTEDGVSYADWLPPRSAGPAHSAESAVSMLREWLGPFPFATYGAVIYPPSFAQGSPRTRSFLSGVALECQGRSLFAEGAASTETVIHEAAHQWIGDSVSLTDWSRDIWWIEGFARFAETLGETDDDRVAHFEEQFRELRPEWVPPGRLDRDELFSQGSYGEGSIVFYALEREVGQARFKQILREFTTRYRHANASTDDLIAVAGEVSGRDLRPFFEAWLEAPVPPASLPD